MNHRITATSTGLRRALLLAVMWLNMAVTPCAMAFDGGDHDCPHMPPADEHAMAGHHDHDHGKGHDQAASSCITLQADCCDAPDATHGLRTDSVELETSPDVIFADTPAIAGLSLLPALFSAAADPPDPPDAFPPRHVLFCVYLD